MMAADVLITTVLVLYLSITVQYHIIQTAGTGRHV